VLEDERFRDAFANPDFEIDEEAVEYTQLNPTKAVNPPYLQSDTLRQRVMDSDEEETHLPVSQMTDEDAMWPRRINRKTRRT